MISTRTSRWALAAVLFPVIAFSETKEAATVMDPVFVEASSTTGTPWQYLAAPGFEIISRCPEAFNAAYVRALRRSVNARLALLPAPFWGELPSPIEIILYDRPMDKNTGYAPAKPIDLSWAGEDKALLGSDSLELTHPVTVGDGDTFINCGNYADVANHGDDLSVDVDTAIRIEVRAPRFPPWFIAGLEGPSGICMGQRTRTAADGDTLVLANALWTSTDETLALQDELKKALNDGTPVRPRSLLPLNKLFAGRPSGGGGELWDAEAALLVRWGLFRFTERRAFLDFVLNATHEPVTEALFTKFLGLTYLETEQQLGAYLPEAASRSIEVPLSPSPNEPVSTRDASSLEVARIIGGWGRLEGRPSGAFANEFEDECLGQADRLFERCLARSANEPKFLASFGLYELQVGDSGRARKALEAATHGSVVCPRAYVELARLRLVDAMPYMPAGRGDLSESDFNDIRELLSTARSQMPSLPGTYSLLARLLEHGPATPTHEQLRVLGDAVHLFPQNAALAAKVAALYGKSGFPQEGAALARWALEFAQSEHDRVLLSSSAAAVTR